MSALTLAQHKLYLHMAVAYMRRLTERRRMYEEECERDARNGHRAHYCIHGTNQWTDYDNICGPCEESLTDQELALAGAYTDMREYMKRLRMFQDFNQVAHTNDVNVRSVIEPLVIWLNEPLEILTTHARPVRNLP